MARKRDTQVVIEAKRLKPWCSRCSATRDLQGHHVIALADGGPDTVENIAVICGYCHREWHAVEDPASDFEEFLDTPRGDWLVTVMQDPQLADQTRAQLVTGFISYRDIRAFEIAGFVVTREGAGHVFRPPRD